MISRPTAGSENTASTTTAPPSSTPVRVPTIVTIGIRALSRACRKVTTQACIPLARAVRM